jgi:hypothetical protein
VNGSISILQDIARQLGKRTKPCECYDANVCDYTVSETTRWKPVPLRGHPFTQQLRAEYKDYLIDLMANAQGVCCSVKGGFDVGVFSVNHPNLVYPVKPTTLRIAGDARWPVFTNPHTGKQAESLRLFLEHPTLHESVQQLIVAESDSLHFFAGCVTLYFRPNSTSELKAALDCLVGLARLFAPASIQWNLEALPPSLRALTPIIQKWAIGDDSERADLLDESPPSELGELVRAVDAHLSEIDRYLDSVGEAMPEAALALQTLEKCAAEARLILKQG